MAAKQALAAELVAPLPRRGRQHEGGRGFAQPLSARTSFLPKFANSAGEGDEEAVWVSRLIAEAGLAKSNSEARSLVAQGGVRIDGRAVKDPQLEVPCRGSVLLEVGKRRIARVVFE